MTEAPGGDEGGPPGDLSAGPARGRPDAAPSGDRLQAFVDGLTREERLLVLVREELYGGSWEELELDLAARRDSKPFIFKLNARIEDDLNRIARLRQFEREQGIDLHPLLGRAPGGEEGAPS